MSKNAYFRLFLTVKRMETTKISISKMDKFGVYAYN